MICVQNRKAVAIGIVSFGISECGSQFPGVYQRICNHVTWMKSLVSNTTYTTTPNPTGCQVPNRRSVENVIDISNGNQYESGQRVPLGTSVRISCALGFSESFPERQSICNTGGTWVPTIGYCQEIEACENSLPNIVNGNISQGSVLVGSVRQISCQTGYRLNGSSSIQCSITGNWTTPGICEAIPCEPLPRIPNAMITSGNLTIGSIRQIVCQAGYFLVGSNTITCSSSGQWSEPPACRYIR